MPAEPLVSRVDVMEFECVDRRREAAAPAGASSVAHRSQLHVLPEPHHRMRAVALRSRVPDTVAIRADEDAFLGFGLGSFDASEKSAQRECLRRGITMMELERPDGAVVPTVLAPPATRVDEHGLHPDPPAAAVVDPRLSTRRRGSTNGRAELLCAPKGEHVRQNRRLYR